MAPADAIAMLNTVPTAPDRQHLFRTSPRRGEPSRYHRCIDETSTARVRHTNTAARVALWTGLSPFVWYTLLPLGRPVVGTAYLFVFPAIGIAALIAGVLGLSRHRADGGGVPESVVGLIGGTVVLLACAVVAFFAYEFAHSNFTF